MTRRGTPIGSRTLRRAGATSQGVEDPPPKPARRLVRLPPVATEAQAAPAVRAVPAEAPAAPGAPLDVRLELLELLGWTKGMILEARTTRKGFPALGQLMDKIAARITAIDVSRQDTGSEVVAVLAKGPVAVAKIRQGIATVAAREVEQGACARCGAALAAETIVRRRTEAGLDQLAPH